MGRESGGDCARSKRKMCLGLENFLLNLPKLCMLFVSLGFVIDWYIFSSTINTQDSDRQPSNMPLQFKRVPSPRPRGAPSTLLIPCASNLLDTKEVTPSQMPTPNTYTIAHSGPPTPSDRTSGSSSRMWRQCGSDILMNFVKDFNHDYLSKVEMQENKKKVHLANIYPLEREKYSIITTK